MPVNVLEEPILEMETNFMRAASDVKFFGRDLTLIHVLPSIG